VACVALLAFADAPLAQILATTYWGSSASWGLSSLPLFILMGELLYRTRLAQDVFEGLAPWMRLLPGRLVHANVVGCGIFAAVSGSSAATAATIGRITIPQLLRRGYDRDLTLGSLAGAGTLGLLIPPSIVMIVYGVAAEVSIGHLFVAGVVPGLLLMALFSGYIAARSAWGREALSDAGDERLAGWADVRLSLRKLMPVVLLIGGVIATIYAGVATPTEAAAFGVTGALVISRATGSLSRPSLMESLRGAVKTTSMIGLILASAAVLSTAMAFLGIPRSIAAAIGAWGLGPHGLIFALTLLYIVLGCFLDGISMIVLTTAVLLPIVKAAGIDLVWFGIFLILVVEMSCITPPVGFNLFVVQGLTGQSIGTVSRAAVPFFLLMIAAVAIITAFPDVVLALPRRMTP
jgi:tripartite ATP-independent transporter DctM subunit